MVPNSKPCLLGNEILDNLIINSSTIGVSGFSSGAMMATQFHVAFSKSISGVGAFAGAPYLYTSLPSDEAIYEETLGLADAGRIDPVENIRDDQVYIFHGTLDSIVPWELGQRIGKFYSRFMDEDHIELKDDIEAGHGFPSANEGGVCSQVGPPNYVNFCNYSGAAELLKKVLGPINENIDQKEYSLSDYDQNMFATNGDANANGMDNQGYVFVPSR